MCQAVPPSHIMAPPLPPPRPFWLSCRTTSATTTQTGVKNTEKMLIRLKLLRQSISVTNVIIAIKQKAAPSECKPSFTKALMSKHCSRYWWSWTQTSCVESSPVYFCWLSPGRSAARRTLHRNPLLGKSGGNRLTQVCLGRCMAVKTIL